jgi:SnoaL-like domain
VVVDAAMDGVERLVAIEDIRALKARYFRCMDTKDWDGFGAVFAADAVMDMTSEVPAGADVDPVIRGRAAIVEFVRGAIDAVTTVHHGHMPEIDVVSPTRATGIWAMEDKLRWPPGAPIATMHGYGHYHESYVKTDGHWYIASIRLSRLRVDVG